MAASKRTKSNTELNEIVETRDNFTVQGGDFLVNERSLDRQTHTNYQVTR